MASSFLPEGFTLHSMTAKSAVWGEEFPLLLLGPLCATCIHSVPRFSPVSCKANHCCSAAKTKLLYRLHTHVVIFGLFVFLILYIVHLFLIHSGLLRSFWFWLQLSHSYFIKELSAWLKDLRLLGTEFYSTVALRPAVEAYTWLFSASHPSLWSNF